MNQPVLSVVLTALNEADNLPCVVNELASQLLELGNTEIIVVDDGSTDDSIARLNALGLPPSIKLIVLRHPYRCGKSAGLHTGVRHAQARLIATMDADGQDDPHIIPRLYRAALELIEKDATPLIIGRRIKRADPFSKRIATKIANFVRSRLLKDSCTDTSSPIKVFPKDLFLSLPQFEGLHRFVPALMQRFGAEMKCIDVVHRPRVFGESKYNNRSRLWRGIFDVAGVYWLLKRHQLPPRGSVDIVSKN